MAFFQIEKSYKRKFVPRRFPARPNDKTPAKRIARKTSQNRNNVVELLIIEYSNKEKEI